MFLFLNDGRGRFTDVSTTRMSGVPIVRALTVSLTDLDGDHDLDMIVGTYYIGGISGHPGSGPMPIRIYKNDGTGVFTEFMRTKTYSFALQHLVLDVDLDGDPDLVVSERCSKYGCWNRIFVNDGTGKLALDESRLPKQNESQYLGGVLDLNRDGWPDLNLGGNPHLNDGRGFFTRTSAPFTSFQHSAEGDADGDGDADLLIWGRGLNGPGQNRLYLWDEDRGFFVLDRSGRLPTIEDDTQAVEWHDLDEDGDLDIVTTNWRSDRCHLNDGLGRFTQFELFRDFSQTIVVDLDGDGDLDLLGVPDSTGPDDVQWNLTRHLVPGNEPRIGQDLDVACYSRTSHFRAGLRTELALATRSAKSVFPGLGTWWIDPNAMLIGSVLDTVPATGHARHHLRIPDRQELIGTTLHLQAIVTTGPFMIRGQGLTNAIELRVEPSVVDPR